MIHIATDGSCIGNPGPGAYGFVARVDNEGLIVKAIPVAHTTVGEMEVRGLLEALLFYIDFCQDQDQATIQCDSTYVVNGYNEWMANWEAKGWKKKGGLAHVELWKSIALAKSIIRHNVTVEWVRAHQNTGSLNDKVDALVNSCARAQEPCNGPAFQDNVDGTPAQFPRDIVIVEKPVVQPSDEDLIDPRDLLQQALDMIEKLASPTNRDAQILYHKIARALEKA